MEKANAQTIGELVTKDYRTAQVFRSFKLDFCCGGNKTVREACTDRGIDYRLVQQALQQLDQAQSNEQDNYNEWAIDFLSDYIVNSHHKFSRAKLPEIRAYAKKVAAVHGRRHPELNQIYHEFTSLYEEMISHLDKEEELLFPYIKELVEARRKGQKPDEPEFGEAANPVSMMEDEHDKAGTVMQIIRELSNDFTPPDDACTTYRLLFENLEAFEKDLHKHVHLENNILFPKALQLEKELFS